MRTVTVNGNDAGQRLDKFLGKLFKSMPAGMLYKAIRKKRVKVNGKRADISYRLSEGDKIDLYINDEFFEDKGGAKYEGKPSEIKIVYEDDNILVADKPSGLPCHSGGNSGDDTLIFSKTGSSTRRAKTPLRPRFAIGLTATRAGL